MRMGSFAPLRMTVWGGIKSLRKLASVSLVNSATLNRAHARGGHSRAGMFSERPRALSDERCSRNNRLAHRDAPAADQVDVILLFGGDGTIHRHLGQLVKLGLPVLVVPAGSGNDFARALGLARVRDSLAAWRRFCSGQDKCGPSIWALLLRWQTRAGRLRLTLRASAPHYFCSVAGLGLDAEVARRANDCRAGCAGTAATR